jgi:hypothetical protein
MKKMKRYEAGGDVEFETKQGENKSIGEDTRARAMAAMEKGNSEEPAVPKKTAAKLTPKAEPKTESKAEPKAEEPKKGAEKLRSELSITKPSAPTMIRGSKNTGTDLKSAIFGGSNESPRMKAAKRAQAMDASNYSMKKGGKVKSASARADGCAIRGKTRA